MDGEWKVEIAEHELEHGVSLDVDVGASFVVSVVLE